MQEYKVTSVNPTGNVDAYGNQGYSIFLEGDTKPVFIKAKNAPVVGGVEFGTITDEQKRSGQGTYRKFTRKQRPDEQTSFKSSGAPGAPGASEKQFKADPDSRESIEWQTSLKAAVEVTRDFYMSSEMPKTVEDYAKEVDKVAVHFKNLINIKPKSVTSDVLPTDDEVDEVELPPVEELEPPDDIGEIPF